MVLVGERVSIEAGRSNGGLMGHVAVEREATMAAISIVVSEGIHVQVVAIVAETAKAVGLEDILFKISQIHLVRVTLGKGGLLLLELVVNIHDGNDVSVNKVSGMSEASRKDELTRSSQQSWSALRKRSGGRCSKGQTGLVL